MDLSGLLTSDPLLHDPAQSSQHQNPDISQQNSQFSNQHLQTSTNANMNATLETNNGISSMTPVLINQYLKSLANSTMTIGQNFQQGIEWNYQNGQEHDKNMPPSIFSDSGYQPFNDVPTESSLSSMPLSALSKPTVAKKGKSSNISQNSLNGSVKSTDEEDKRRRNTAASARFRAKKKS